MLASFSHDQASLAGIIAKITREIKLLLLENYSIQCSYSLVLYGIDSAYYDRYKGYLQFSLSLFSPNYPRVNMTVALLHISKNGRMHWDEKKDLFGSRRDRHSLGRFVIKQACHLPVTVQVTRSKKSRSFHFHPTLVDDHEKLVLLTHERYTIGMDFDDIVKWIQIYITSNKMYEQDYFKSYTT